MLIDTKGNLKKGPTYFGDHVTVVDDEAAEDLRLREVFLHVRLLLADDPDAKVLKLTFPVTVATAE